MAYPQTVMIARAVNGTAFIIDPLLLHSRIGDDHFLFAEPRGDAPATAAILRHLLPTQAVDWRETPDKAEEMLAEFPLSIRETAQGMVVTKPATAEFMTLDAALRRKAEQDIVAVILNEALGMGYGVALVDGFGTTLAASKDYAAIAGAALASPRPDLRIIDDRCGLVGRFILHLDSGDGDSDILHGICWDFDEMNPITSKAQDIFNEWRFDSDMRMASSAAPDATF